MLSPGKRPREKRIGRVTAHRRLLTGKPPGQQKLGHMQPQVQTALALCSSAQEATLIPLRPLLSSRRFPHTSSSKTWRCSWRPPGLSWCEGLPAHVRGTVAWSEQPSSCSSPSGHDGGAPCEATPKTSRWGSCLGIAAVLAKASRTCMHKLYDSPST
jgi:hypothetical protein